VLSWEVSVASPLETGRIQDRSETIVFLKSHVNSCSQLSSEQRLLLKVTVTAKQAKLLLVSEEVPRSTYMPYSYCLNRLVDWFALTADDLSFYY